MKLPLGYKKSSISSALRNYLLGGFSRASIVKTFSQVYYGSINIHLEKSMQFLSFICRVLSTCFFFLFLLIRYISYKLWYCGGELGDEVLDLWAFSNESMENELKFFLAKVL